MFERSDLADICRPGLLCVLRCDESLRQKPQSKYSTQTAAQSVFVPDFAVINCRLMRFCFDGAPGYTKY